MNLGWKTIAGGALLLTGATVTFFGFPDLADVLIQAGAGLGTIGIAHKIQKAVNSVNETVNKAAALKK